MKLTSTKQAQDNGIKVLVHGPAGAGKTYLSRTTGGNPVIISAESGLMSLRDIDLPVIEINSIADLEAAYSFLTSSADAKDFDWIILDSISEIAEQCLSFEKKQTKDGRAAYGALNDKMAGIIRAFRDLPKNVYFSCKQERVKDEVNGTFLYSPSLPGTKLSQSIAYFFDFVFALRVERTDEGEITRYLQTARDYQYEAKDRSGALPLFMPPDLSLVKNHLYPQTQQTQQTQQTINQTEDYDDDIPL